VKWPTATQAAIAAVLSLVVALVLRRSRPTRVGDLVLPAATEFALVASLYSVWRMAKKLPLTQSEGAVERARQIVRFQDFLHLPSELSLQRFALAHDQVGWLSTAYYAVVHVPATIIFLIWLFVRHRDKYPHWRNALAIVTGFCLFIRFVHVAPPRFLTDLGYIDLSSVYGMAVYGPVGTGVSGQFVAMPSLHVAWAGVVTFGVLAASTSKWRYLIVLHLVGTLFVVAATGHHWWLDGAVALALLWMALKIDTIARRIHASRRASKMSMPTRELLPTTRR
jgi:hypothetical protein